MVFKNTATNQDIARKSVLCGVRWLVFFYSLLHLFDNRYCSNKSEMRKSWSKVCINFPKSAFMLKISHDEHRNNIICNRSRDN